MRRPDLHHWCDYCWRALRALRTPPRLIGAEADACCHCLKLSESGIYMWEDPTMLPCQGDHDWYIPGEAQGRA